MVGIISSVNLQSDQSDQIGGRKFFLSERKLQLVELVRIKLKRDVIYSPRNIFLNIIVFRL